MTRSLHLDIAGMSCNHCVMAVTRGLEKIDGVRLKHVEVGTADVDYDDGKTSPGAITQAVEDAGYTVTQRS